LAPLLVASGNHAAFNCGVSFLFEEEVRLKNLLVLFFGEALGINWFEGVSEVEL
jgi:hypothetical protein